ncbi:hypothetical protein [Vibrio sp. WXL103]|uniref:hypothetical protein n=1 Tax=unclassified Vibrio TaxID=2614977 RepID=UPI003EC5BDF9
MYSRNTKLKKVAAMVTLALLAGCNSSEDKPSSELPETPVQPLPGRWMTGDLHVHTSVSADARDYMLDVFYHAFDEFELDFVFLSNHLRDDSQDWADNNIGGILYSEAMKRYEWPEINYLTNNLYDDKIVFTTYEWDMPAHEHFNIAIFSRDGAQSHEVYEAAKLFEYKFSHKNNTDKFDPQDLAKWERMGIERYNGESHDDREGKHQDAIKAFEWMQEHYAELSYGMLNHPLRYKKSYTLDEIRDLHNAAPDVFFLVEGMVGGQFNNNRGDYNIGHAPDHPDATAGLYGGVDPVVAEVGGWWDAMLSEGRKIWNVANSDHHFKIREPYTSSYYPGEYSKTYTYVQGDNDLAVLEGLRSGQVWATYGDLINELDFTVTTNGQTAHMGQEAFVSAGDKVTISIRFKSPEFNNLETRAGNSMFGTNPNPGVHHVDIISGGITGMIMPDDEGYDSADNSDAKVVATFTADDWHVDKDGYYAMTYSFEAERDEYYRLRGTAQDYDVPGFVENGEPLRWEGIDRIEGESAEAYRDRFNHAIYSDIWFYSNPVYITLKSPRD